MNVMYEEFELHGAAIWVITKYGCRVDADFREIKALVDMCYVKQIQLEEAVEALKRENGE
jgi:hypothetical protein